MIPSDSVTPLVFSLLLVNFIRKEDLSKLIFMFFLVKLCCSKIFQNNNKWKQCGVTIAGGFGEGSQLIQLYWPYGICVDDDQAIYVADYGNHRVVKWKCGGKSGQIVAGANGKGNRRDQLNLPTDVILDKKNDSLIICDAGNRRVVRWCRRSGTNQQVLISNIASSRVTMDNNGDLYVSDWEKNEVRRWKPGDTSGTLVAGGNGPGDHLSQLNSPSYVFVDEDHSVYISDTNNHRVMKWIKGAKEGIVVAGGHGQGDSLKQLSLPQGVAVDQMGHVFVADCYNDRIVCWSKGSREGRIIAGGNGQGQKANQFNYPDGLALDRQGNLYVVDWGNNRVQKFDICLD
jgi:sugar lactone lactonase YvrE